MNMLSIKFDRAIAKGYVGRIAIIGLAVLVVVPIVLWFIGWMGQYAALHAEAMDGLEQGLLWNTIEVYLDINSKPEAFHFTKRFYFLIVGAFGAFLFNGLLISMLVSLFESRRDRWERGDLHYGKTALGNFTVVIGGNGMVPDLVGQLLDETGIDHVLVMTSREVAALRKNLVSRLGRAEERVVVYYGERTSREDLKRLLLHHTRNDIYVIGEQLDLDQSGSHHDVKNMDCVQKIAELLHEAGCRERKTCRVMFEYQSTFSVFQYADIRREISAVLDFRPFNYYETWARKVLVCKDIDPGCSASLYLPLEGKEPITADSETFVHLIVVGMSRMGIALAVEAAHLAHYPNFITKGKCTRITFIDRQARGEMNFVQRRYRDLFAVSRWRYVEAESDTFYGDHTGLSNAEWREPRRDDAASPYRDAVGYSLGDPLVDVEWEFVGGSLEMPSVQEFIRRECKDGNVRLTIAVCIPQDNAALAASLSLPDEVYRQGCNVLVYQPHGDALLWSLAGEPGSPGRRFANLRPFGMTDGCYSVAGQDMMEMVCDAFNEEYGKTAQWQIPGRNQLRRRFGMAVVETGKSPAARRWSGYYAASHLWTKLRSVKYAGRGLALDERSVELLAAVEHVRWNMEQLLMGYAPLTADEYRELLRRRKKALRVAAPDMELMALDTADAVGEDARRQMTEWLEAWREYDEMKEGLKADMRHADICSLDVLAEIDKESIEYDRVLVKILPRVEERCRNLKVKS